MAMPETTEEELDDLPDQELEIFKEKIQGKSKATIYAYLQGYRKLKNQLGKDIHSTSQELIIKTAELLSTNLNTQASFINIGYMVREMWNEDVKVLIKARQDKKRAIQDYTKEENQKLLPILN